MNNLSQNSMSTIETENDVSQIANALLASMYVTLALLGVIGNALVILIVIKVANMRTATNCYLVSLATSDTLFFISALPSELHDLWIPNRYDFGWGGCMMQIFLTYLTMNTSSLSVAAFSVERYIGICYPMKARYMCTVSRACAIVAGIWAFSILYNSPWLYMATVIQVQNTTRRICHFRFDRNNIAYKAVYVGDILVFYILPMALYVCMYTRIARTLRQRNAPQTETYDTTNTNGHLHSDTHKQGAQVVKMLAVVTLVFAVLWMPYKGMVLYNSFATNSFSPDWFLYLAKLFVFINAAINPILYNMMSSKFRDAFWHLLGRTKQSTNRAHLRAQTTDLHVRFKDLNNSDNCTTAM